MHPVVLCVLHCGRIPSPPQARLPPAPLLAAPWLGTWPRPLRSPPRTPHCQASAARPALSIEACGLARGQAHQTGGAPPTAPPLCPTEFTGMYISLQECTSVCRHLHHFAGIYISLQEFTSVCRNLHQFASVYGKVTDIYTICTRKCDWPLTGPLINYRVGVSRAEQAGLGLLVSAHLSGRLRRPLCISSGGMVCVVRCYGYQGCWPYGGRPYEDGGP